MNDAAPTTTPADLFEQVRKLNDNPSVNSASLMVTGITTGAQVIDRFTSIRVPNGDIATAKKEGTPTSVAGMLTWLTLHVDTEAGAFDASFLRKALEHALSARGGYEALGRLVINSRKNFVVVTTTADVMSLVLSQLCDYEQPEVPE